MYREYQPNLSIMNILDQDLILELFRSNYEIFLGCLFLGTFIVTYYLIPKVLWVSKEKNLTAAVVGRSSHTVETPSFGGVAFFITLILVLSLIQSMRLSYVGNHLIAAITVLFMVGLKDDLVVSTARVKLFGQITATCFIIFSPELHLASLEGFWGIYEIPETLGLLFKGVLVIALINAYNLIDGIDGLASMVGIVMSSTFTVAFYTTNQPFYALVAISLAGILSAFLRFNFSRGQRKIFMGDSGSLVVGLVLAFLGIRILVMEPSIPLMQEGHSPANRLLFLACVLFIPIFDTLRVIMIRKLNGTSPFSPDKNHCHHVLLNLGYSHKKASFFLASLNLVVIVTYLYISTVLSNLWLSLFVVGIYASVFFLFFELKKKSALVAKSTHGGEKGTAEKEASFSGVSRWKNGIF
jgi:UDP-N-acetylmuramyl pentapeptide phosphotransferase/UDP-N-acetylglucosamine-1-phosphate transferase